MDRLNWAKQACFVSVLCATTAITLQGQTFTTLYNFDGTDGDEPYVMTLVQGPDGALYGTTRYGGNGTCQGGCGTAFQISDAGALTTLYNFNVSGNGGCLPYAGLALGTDGSFYGTTIDCGGIYGTVFKMTAGGTLTGLHSFLGPDGAEPWGGLVQGTSGNFYGTTAFGGAGGPYNQYGTVFEISPAGTFTLLHSFDETDGATPLSALIQGSDGNFYGTTSGGGTDLEGTVFKITSGGTLTTLHSFAVTDGAYPSGGLVQAGNGDLYGTTEYGGAHEEGTVFRITLAGSFKTLHSFDGADGASPIAGLNQATDGNFYGTTSSGGSGENGTVFMVTSQGKLTTLHNFSGTDGSDPSGGLVQSTNGTLYGTTYAGGTSGDGTVFSLTVGLGPFIKTLPTSGRVGTPVRILGMNLTGASRVTFNGTAATFTVNSTGTAINTTVPAGATTGPVQVITPGGTLSSNVPFRVLP